MPQTNDQDFDAAFADFSKPDAPPPSPSPVVAEAAPAPAPAPSEPAVAAAGADDLERLRADLAEALHRERSTANRMSSRDRENASLQARVRELEQENQQLRSRAQAPAPAADDNEDDVLSGAEDLRKAVERRVQRALEPVQRIAADAEQRSRAAEAAAAEAAQFVTPIIQRDAEQAEATLKTQLDDEFGGWDGVVRDVKFKAWLAKKPDAIRDLYNQGSTFGECSSVLTLFSAETGHQFQKRKQDTQNSTGSDLRLVAGIRPGVGSMSPRPNPDDFDGAFAEFANRKKSA